MRARSVMTFIASAALTLTACMGDDSSTVSPATGTTAEADPQIPPAAVADAAVVRSPGKPQSVEGRGASAVADSGAGEDLDASDAGVCGSGPGKRDESQFESSGNMVISPTQPAGQTFSVVTTGVLTGIEFGLASCNGVDPAASVVLTVSRGSTVIATSSISASSISTSSCGAIAVSPTEVGAGFFDLSDSCVAVTSGDELTATVSIAGSTGSCDSSTLQCVGGAKNGSFCFADDECRYVARLGIQTSDAYDGGTMISNGNPMDWDASFKTFVR